MNYQFPFSEKKVGEDLMGPSLIFLPHSLSPMEQKEVRPVVNSIAFHKH